MLFIVNIVLLYFDVEVINFVKKNKMRLIIICCFFLELNGYWYDFKLSVLFVDEILKYNLLFEN